MSRSRSYYDSYSDNRYGNRTILVKTQNDTLYKHGSISDHHHHPQRVYTTANSKLAIPESTTHVYRSVSTGACPQRGTVKVIHQSNTKSRSSSRGRSFERGRTLDINRTISIDSISDRYNEPQRAHVATDGMLALPKSTTHIYRSASTGAGPQCRTVQVIRRSNTESKSSSQDRSRSRSHERGRTLETNRSIYHSHHHRSRSYSSRSRSRNMKADINITRLDVNRPTYIKISREYLSPDTLDAYNLPWEWDLDTNFIIIKQWISYDCQQVLFAHTRRIRESRAAISRSTAKKTVTTTKVTTLKPNQDRNNFYVARKRDKSWSPTTVVYKKDKSPTRTTVVYRKKDRSRSPTTVVYKKKDRSRSPTTVVYRKDKSPTRTTVVYRKNDRSRSPTTVVYT